MKAYKIQIEVDEDVWIEFSRLAIKDDLKPKELILKLIMQAIKECNIVNS